MTSNFPPKKTITKQVILNVLARSNKQSTTRACAEALHSFSSLDDCTNLLIKGGAIQALVLLSQIEDNRTLQSCAATFCNLLSTENTHQTILDQQCLPCFLTMAQDTTDPILIEYLSCLFNNLACGPKKTMVVQGGIVPCIAYLAEATSSLS